LSERLAGLEDERIEIDKGTNTLRHPISHAGDDAAAVRVAAQDNVRQFLPHNQVLHVEDMRFKVQVPVQ